MRRGLDEKDDIHAGRTPRVPREGLTVRDLVNEFLSAKRHLVETGEIVLHTWTDYHKSCRRVVAIFGPDRLVDDLAADDFGRLRKALSKTRGPVAVGNEIQRVRVLLKYGWDEGLIDKPIRYGQSFERPSRKTLRKARYSNGPRMFQAAEIRAMLDAASQQGPGIASGANLILLYDGHGSTRGLVELIRMRLRRTDVAAVVQCLIIAKQGGVKISCAEMEKAWTQKVDIEKVTLAMVRAKREGLDVTFQDLVDAELDDRLAEKLQGKDEGHKQEFAYR